MLQVWERVEPSRARERHINPRLSVATASWQYVVSEQGVQSNFPDRQADKDAFSISQHGEPCTPHQVKHETSRCYDMIQENEDRLLMYPFETRWECINMFASSLTFSFICKGGGLHTPLPSPLLAFGCQVFIGIQGSAIGRYVKRTLGLFLEDYCN